MTPDIPSLRALALRATPGPYQIAPWDDCEGCALQDTSGEFVAGFGGWRTKRECADTAAYFSAASPAVVLALLDRLERAEKRCAAGDADYIATEHSRMEIMGRCFAAEDARDRLAAALTEIVNHDPCETDYRIHEGMRSIARAALATTGADAAKGDE